MTAEEMTLTPIKDETGEVVHFIAIKQDVTERVRTEQVVRDSQARLASIIDSAGDIKVNAFPSADTDEKKDQVVDVPLEENREGFFSHMFDRNKPLAKPSEETVEQETETALAKEPADVTDQDTGTNDIDESTGPTAKSAETIPSTPPDNVTSTTTAASSTTEPEQNKNLLKRFWDRITSGASDSTIEQGEESERDRRDAEVLESAGGEL